MMFVKIIEAELGLKAVKEYQFHPTRKWRFDYAIPELMIAIEIEGGAWTQGRHTRGKGFIEDMEKYNAAVALGWRLLRFTPEQVKTVKPIEAIEGILKFVVSKTSNSTFFYWKNKCSDISVDKIKRLKKLEP